MTDSFLQLPLSQLVDLVVNSPEKGVVNFNLLLTVLHVIVNQLKAEGLTVEVHGSDATQIQKMLGDSKGATVTVSEVKGKVDKAEKEKKPEETLLVVDYGLSSANIGVAVTKKQIDTIIDELNNVKAKVKELTELPGNAGLIEAVKNTESTSTPVVDMYQILSLIKRMEAAEIGMSKMASMVEDLIKSPVGKAAGKKGSSKNLSTKGTSTKKKKESSHKLVDDGTAAQTSNPTSPRTSQDYEPPITIDMNQPMELVMANVVEELASVRGILDNLMGTSRSSETDSKGKSHCNNLSELFSDVAELKDKFLRRKPSDGDDNKESAGPDTSDLPPDIQLALLEERFKQQSDHLNKLDQNFNDEINKLHHQFTDIEKDFNDILSKISTALPSGDSNLDEPNQCCAAVHTKLMKVQTNFEDLAAMSVKFIERAEEKHQQMDVMLEQIELLKSLKADKEDMEEALADKADACTVHRKVSHDQFDTACDELSKGIEETLEKLSQQESLWQLALNDIQNEIGNKLDKMDLGPLREFINNKLKMLQDKMRSLAALKREQEAAGSKSKFLRDVNCISCDKDVVMRKEMDVSLRPTQQAVPPTRSMGPYLAYELDALRKQQKTVPGGKNINTFEKALKGQLKKADDHICNRYCGGSHTLTTPQQRVTRLGHFLAQWGPEAYAADSLPEPKVKGSITHAPGEAVPQKAPPPTAAAGEKRTSVRVSLQKSSKTSLKKVASPTKGSEQKQSPEAAKQASKTDATATPEQTSTGKTEEHTTGEGDTQLETIPEGGGLEVVDEGDEAEWEGATDNVGASEPVSVIDEEEEN